MPCHKFPFIMRRNIPSTQALACFEAAARHESYTRAAQELSLTQSAVSRQIPALEEFLGVPLFRRTRHGVALTPAGADYARQVAPRLQGLERDTLDVMAHQGEGGALSLAAVPTFATRWLIPRLPQLARQHPDIVVHIETPHAPFLVCRHHVRRRAVCRHRRAGGKLARCPRAAAHARRCGAGVQPAVA